MGIISYPFHNGVCQWSFVPAELCIPFSISTSRKHDVSAYEALTAAFA